ncbi:MAG: alpha/beta hydrolase fold domain-containing protein [Planctomycetota bacterium]|nr:alpha/beta hydrolase fold domain-containing protein [Planctomycetota bacterium]
MRLISQLFLYLAGPLNQHDRAPMKPTRRLITSSKAVLAVLTLFVLSACTSTGGRSGQTPDRAWTIGSRTLSAPVGASDALRAAIENTPQPNVAEHIRQTTFTTKEEWIQVIRAANAGNTQRAEALTERRLVTIKKAEIAGVTVRAVTPADIDPANENRLFVHVHGGAYVIGGGSAGLGEAILIANRAKIPVMSIDYRMPPEHPFPAAIDDVVAVWRSLLKDRDAKSMALGGSSAGGGLTLASTLRFKQLGLEVPGALWAGTPWADLTKTGDSHFTNEGIDRMLVSYDGLLEGAAKLYADGRELKTPLISPVYGDFEGFPPTYLVTGTRDLFLSDTVRVHRKMRVAGVVADLNVYEGVSHGDYASVADSPELQQAIGELGAFLLRHLE